MKKRPEESGRQVSIERGVFMSPISEAQRKAVRKYNEKSYDRLEIKVPKGRKAELQEHASAQGESLNGFVNRAIDEAVEREGQAAPDGASEPAPQE